VGQCKYAPIMGADGGILNDPILLRVEERRFWLSLADSDVLFWARGVALNSGLDVEIGEPDVWPIQVQGPRSADVMSKLFGDEVMSLPYYFCVDTSLDGIPVVVSRTGWTSEIGYEIYLRDSSRGDDLWERVMDAGKEFDIRPIAPCEARRIEGGIFNYGSDFTWRNNPLEVTGMERLVELDQEADFIGKEALKRIAAEGVQNKLVGVELSGGPMEWELTQPWPVVVDGSQAGRVTDAIFSPRLERNIGYAWVPIASAGEGNTLQVRTPEGEATATVTKMPFVDPGKRIPAAAPTTGA
jgi:aminomethyltransferase